MAVRSIEMKGSMACVANALEKLPSVRQSVRYRLYRSPRFVSSCPTTPSSGPCASPLSYWEAWAGRTLKARHGRLTPRVRGPA